VLRCFCAQDDLEPVLRALAESLEPGRCASAPSCTDFGRTPTTSPPTCGTGGDTRRAGPLPDRGRRRPQPRAEALGIAMHGTPGLYRSLNVLLRADLTPWTADRPGRALLHRAAGPEGDVSSTINGVNRWGF
jgi:hypothetical protein